MLSNNLTMDEEEAVQAEFLQLQAEVVSAFSVVVYSMPNLF
jgi:hypothetical protein